jgi:hypothetical protein
MSCSSACKSSDFAHPTDNGVYEVQAIDVVHWRFAAQDRNKKESAPMIPIANVRRSAAAFGMELPTAACLMGLDVVARLMPHAPSFTPVAASAVFAGMIFRSRVLAMTAPISGMVLSDLVLGSYDWRIMSVVYVSLALPAILSMWARRFQMPIVLVPLVLFSSLLFFATTNFAVWAFSGMYESDLAGLVHCYAAALPFLHNSVMGDIFWTAILFGGWWVAKRYQWSLFVNRARTTDCAGPS